MSKTLPCLLLFTLCAPSYVRAAAHPTLAVVRVATTIEDDFTTGELNAWESYPFAQDMGFDPEIWCVTEPAFGARGYSLCKVIKPDDTDWPHDENLVGMTKKIRLWTNSSTEF